MENFPSWVEGETPLVLLLPTFLTTLWLLLVIDSINQWQREQKGLLETPYTAPGQLKIMGFPVGKV